MARLTMAEAIRAALREEMRRDPQVFLLGEDIGVPGGWGGPFTVTRGLAEEFGHERVLDTPISEAAIVGVAIGSSILGFRAVAEVQYADFLFCAMDQLVNNAAKLRYMSGGQFSLPIVVRAPCGATTRGAQHSQCPEAYFLQASGIKIAMPSTPHDAKGLLKTAIRDDDPVLFFEHKRLYGSSGREGELDVAEDVPDEEYTVPFGRARVCREGKDVTIIGTMLMVHEAIAAAGMLAEGEISAEVIDLRTLVPLDTETIFESIRKTGRLLIAEENPARGGWGEHIAALVASQIMDVLDAPISRVACPDTPVPFSPVLEETYIPNRQGIFEAALALCA